MPQAQPMQSRPRPITVRAKLALIDLSHVDWRLLRKQKRALVNIAARSAGGETRIHVSACRREAIQGLIHLLDHLQDEAAKDLGEETIFGQLRD